MGVIKSSEAIVHFLAIGLVLFAALIPWAYKMLQRQLLLYSYQAHQVFEEAVEINRTTAKKVTRLVDDEFKLLLLYCSTVEALAQAGLSVNYGESKSPILMSSKFFCFSCAACSSNRLKT
jgi:hypothetical protein